MMFFDKSRHKSEKNQKKNFYVGNFLKTDGIPDILMFLSWMHVAGAIFYVGNVNDFS